jgi:hypothetical protein
MIKTINKRKKIKFNEIKRLGKKIEANTIKTVDTKNKNK